MVIGIDVSYAQGKPDWKMVKNSSSVEFVYARASCGLKGPDTSFQHNWAALPETGIRRGAYHFFTATDDPVKQAELFYRVVGPLRDADLPPVIDVEVVRPPEISGATFAKNVRAFMETAERLFSRKLVVYTGGPIFDSETLGADAEDIEYIASHDLWLAAYVTNPGRYVPSAWSKRGKTWTLWQKSGDKDAKGDPGARFTGIKTVVDLNVAQGAAENLAAWVEASKIAPPPRPPAEPVPQIIAANVSSEPAIPDTSAPLPKPQSVLGFLLWIIRSAMEFFQKGKK